jgi:hypothetical protein
MSPALEHLELALEAAPGPLLPQVRRLLAAHLGADAEALRWAITRVASPEPPTGPVRLTLEAVVLRLPL